MNTDLPLVSFIIVARNASRHLPLLFSHIVRQDYPKEKLEILLIDGNSTDTTGQLMQDFKDANKERIIRLFSNPNKILASGWNIGIENSSGEIVIRVDAHSEIPPDFISNNVKALEKGENIVGGAVLTKKPEGKFNQLLYFAESSRFGGGVSSFRQIGRAKYTDTLAYAAYRKKIFETVGIFNTNLSRNQDNELHCRIHKAGYKFFYDPAIKSYYIFRSKFKELLIQRFKNGYWIGLTLAIEPKAFGLRYFVPFFFVTGMILALLCGFFYTWMPMLFLLSLYFVVAVWFTTIPFFSSVYNPRIALLLLPFIFLFIHLAYGLGTIAGLIKLPFFAAGNLISGKDFSYDKLNIAKPHQLNTHQQEQTLQISIVIPCRNEEKYIAKCLNSIIQSNYEKTLLDVWVCDGRSNDNTRGIVEAISKEHTYIKLIDNPMQDTPHGLNIGIKNSKGYAIIILGAHSELSENYIEECVNILIQHEEVGCVGGLMESIFDGMRSKVVASAMSSPFGVGNAYFRTGMKEGYVDTVAFGAYKRTVLGKIGLFDEELVRNQDDELNYRITKSGSKIWLTHKARLKYYVRGSFLELFRQYYQYGYWKVYVNKKHRTITTYRQLVPSMFVLFLLLGFIIVYIVFKVDYYPYRILFPYLAVIMSYFSIGLIEATKNFNEFKKVAGMLLAFFVLHISYGLGYLKGIFDVMLLGKKPAV